MESQSAAKHARVVTKGTGAIAWRFISTFRWQYIPLLLSDYSREILRRKYDAIATDRAYENKPSGLLGPIGRSIDKAVLNFPTHEALRQRLSFVVEDLKTEFRRKSAHGDGKVRVLSAPCGLARDVITASTELRREDARAYEGLRLYGLDLDATDEVLPMAAVRAKQANVEIKLSKADLFKSQHVTAAVGPLEQFEIVNCIGLTPWLSLVEVGQLVSIFHQLLAPGGLLIIDNFAPHKHTKIAKDLEIVSTFHDPAEFVARLAWSGFRRIREDTTSNGVNTVYVFERA